MQIGNRVVIFVYYEMTERSSTRKIIQMIKKSISTSLYQHALDEIAITQFVDFRNKSPIMAPRSRW